MTKQTGKLTFAYMLTAGAVMGLGSLDSGCCKGFDSLYFRKRETCVRAMAFR